MMTRTKKTCIRLYPKIAAFSLLIALLAGCLSRETETLPVVSDYMLCEINEIRNLRVGVVPGPYWDMFEEAVLPSLEEMGYTATFFYYFDYASPNFALEQNEIDLNIFQHYLYLNNFKFENDLALSAIMEIPTVSMSVFSNHFDTINDVWSGASVSIPDDASNLARALRVLEAANMLTLDPSIDKSKATPANIVSNPHGLVLVPVRAHELVESLKSYDMSVINGNYAVSGGLNLSEALYQEVLIENYMNVITVRTEDLSKQFVRDVIEAVYSDSFRDIIADPAGNYVGFQWPRWLHDIMDMIEARG